MGLSNDVVARGCERVFARVCEVGRAVPAGTPAAAFLAAAARRIDQAQQRLGPEPDIDDLHETVRLLSQAGSLLDDVARLSEERVEGLDRVCVIVDGLCVSLEMEQRETHESPARRGIGPAGFGLG